jgi:hypothetical protein
MKKSDDPPRLTDDPDVPSPLADAVRAARGPAPDRARLEALAISLGLPPSVLPPMVPPAAGMAAGAGAAKLAITGLAATVVGAVAVVAAVGLSAGRHRAPVTSAPPASVAQLECRALQPRENDPEIPLLQPPAPSLPPVARATAPAPSPRRRHPARSVPAPVVAAPAAPVEAPSDAASRLREEAALVQSAERLLASDPAGALRLTEERRRRFPRGALDQEAEVVAIDALLRLGRRPEASARAHAFESAHAASLHARRIKRLLGE